MSSEDVRVSPDGLRRHARGPVRQHVDTTQQAVRLLSEAAAAPAPLPEPWAEVETRLDEVLHALEQVGRAALRAAERSHDGLEQTADRYAAVEQTNEDLSREHGL